MSVYDLSLKILTFILKINEKTEIHYLYENKQTFIIYMNINKNKCSLSIWIYIIKFTDKKQVINKITWMSAYDTKGN